MRFCLNKAENKAGRVLTKHCMESFEGCHMRDGETRVLVVCVLFLTASQVPSSWLGNATECVLIIELWLMQL